MIGISFGKWRRRVRDNTITVRILIKEKFWTPFTIMFSPGKRPKI